MEINGLYDCVLMDIGRDIFRAIIPCCFVDFTNDNSKHNHLFCIYTQINEND